MVILGLGSNKGDRAAYLREALGQLGGILGDLRFSSIYETKALLPENAPSEWDRPYFNMAVAGSTPLSPQALFLGIKAIEKKMGRKAAERWSPREIDIDILAFDDLVVDTPELHIPHRGLLTRDFALLPLVELAPDWRYPAVGVYQDWKAADIATAKAFQGSAAAQKISEALCLQP